MSNKAIIEFGLAHLREDDIQGKSVIEVGSYDINGSLRSVINTLNPQSYVGVDIAVGPGVDEICSINDIVTSFGKESFDVVITTELMEHVLDWRNAISNLKNILRPEGVIILTTRSKGFPYHGYPYDFWRYEMEDMDALFADMSIDAIEKDYLSPGVFIKAYKPDNFTEKNLDKYDLYSIIRNRRCRSIGKFDIGLFKMNRTLRWLASRILPTRIKKAIQTKKMSNI